MTASVGQLFVEFGAETRDFTRAFEGVADSISALSRNLTPAAAQMSSALGNVGEAARHAGLGFRDLVSADLVADGIRSAASAIWDAGKNAVVMAGQLEQSKIAFTTMLGSAQKADAFLRELKDFAAHTPFELAGLQDASKKLLAMGFEAQSVVPMMTAVGNSVAALGGGASTIDRVTTALGQMKAKGKVSAEEMMQLTEAGIPAWDMLAKKIGVSVPEAMKMAERGTIASGTAINAILNGMNDRFGGMMAQQSKTFLGAWSNMQDGATRALTAIGTEVIEKLNLTPIVGRVGEAFTSLADAIENGAIDKQIDSIKASITGAFSPQVQGLVAGVSVAIGTYLTGSMVIASRTALANLVPALATMGATLTGTVIPALVSAATGFMSVIAAGAPFMAVGAAVAAIAIPIIKNWDILKETFATFADAGMAHLTAFYTYLRGVFSNVGKIVGEVGRFLSKAFGGAFEGLPDEMQTMINGMQAKLGELPGLPAKPMAEFSNTIRLGTEDVGAAFKHAFNAYASDAKSVLGSMTAPIAGFVSQATGSIKTFGKDTAAAVAGAGKAVNQYVKDTSTGVQNVGKAAVKAGKDAKKGAEAMVAAVDLLGTKVNGADQIMQGLWGSLDEITRQADLLGPAFDADARYTETLNRALLDVARVGGPGAAEAIATINETLALIPRDLAEPLNGVDQVLQGVWQQLALVDQKAQLLGPTFDGAGKMSDILNQALEKVAEVGGEDAAPAIALLNEAIGRLPKAIKPAAATAREGMADVKATVDALRDSLTKIGATLGFAVADGFLGATSKAADFTLSLYEAATAISTIGPRFDTFTKETLPALTQQAQTAADWVGQIGSAALAAVQGGIASFETACRTLSEGGLTMLGQGLQTAWGHVVTFGQGLMTFATATMPSFAASIATAVSTIGIGTLALGGLAVGVSVLGAGLLVTSKNWGEFTDRLKVVINYMSGPMLSGWGAVADILKAVGGVVGGLGITWEGLSDVAKRTMHDAGLAVSRSMNVVIRGVNAAVDAINSMSWATGVSLNRVDLLSEVTWEQAQANEAWYKSALETVEATRMQDKAIAALAGTLTQSLSGGFQNALSGAIKGFLDGTKSLTSGLRDGVRDALIAGIADAATQGAILKGAFGKQLEQLSTLMAGGNWGGAQGIIKDLAAQVPALAQNLASTLKPLRDTLQASFSGQSTRIAEVMDAQAAALKALTFDQGVLGKTVDEATAKIDIFRKTLTDLSAVGATGDAFFAQTKSQLDALLGAQAATATTSTYGKWAEQQKKAGMPSETWTRDAWEAAGMPALADGGVTRRPMTALIGEAGPEIVAPLTPSVFSDFGKGIAQHSPDRQSGGGTTLYVTLNYRGNGSEGDMEDLCDRFVSHLRLRGVLS